MEDIKVCMCVVYVRGCQMPWMANALKKKTYARKLTIRLQHMELNARDFKAHK